MLFNLYNTISGAKITPCKDAAKETNILVEIAQANQRLQEAGQPLVYLPAELSLEVAQKVIACLFCHVCGHLADSSGETLRPHSTCVRTEAASIPKNEILSRTNAAV